MANITEILGTDSISSSRPVINSNFQLLNDDIADLQGLLDPTSATLSGVSSVTTQALTVSEGSNIAQFTNTGISFDRDFESNGRTTIAGQLVKSGIDGSIASPSSASGSNELTENTYLINGTFNIPEGSTDGQEVTFINVAGTSVEISGLSLSVSSLQLDDQNSTVTLRFIGDFWYVISSYAATIS